MMALRPSQALAPAIETRGLTVAYGRTGAVEDVTLSIAAGRMTAILGPNGAGKSSLLKGILGFVPAEGELRLLGAPAEEARPRIAYVPQRAAVDWDFPIHVEDVVMMGAWRETGLLGRLTPALRARASASLARVGLTDFARRRIGALSGGQQQRVFLARALMQEAALYLLDEPFAGVDAATEAAIVRVLHELRDAGATVVAVHHDLSTVAAYFDRVVLLNRRLVAEGPVAAVFTPENVARAYGLPMLSAVPA